MKQPPKLLTAKDCLYLEDLMNVTSTTSKKINYYSTITERKQIANFLKSVEKRLNTQFTKLLDIIGD